MSKILAIFCVMLILLLFCGCQSRSSSVLPELNAVSTRGEKVMIDGKINENFWHRAKTYPLIPPDDQHYHSEHWEPGQVKLAYDDKNLYVLAKFTDSDVTQYAATNHTLACSTGDLVEVFLWPSAMECYWEIYGTPNNKYTVIAYPSFGRRLFDEAIKHNVKIPVATKVNGTLNDYSDRDCGFTMEMAIPQTELLKNGGTFDNNGGWRILIARYNYSRYLPKVQCSATSRLSKTSYHNKKEYGILRFSK